MKYTRMAGQRLQEDDPAAKESKDTVNSVMDPSFGSGGRSADMDNYAEGGIYNSGQKIGQSGGYTGSTEGTRRTLSGEFDIDNSDDANINRMNKYINGNRDAQEFYSNTSSIAQGAINRAAENKYINTEALDQRVGQREMYNRAKGDVYQSEIFGDVWKDSNTYIDEDRKPQPWESSEPAEGVEQPDWEEMYNKYSNFGKKK